jgi:hypothetical protein
MTVCRAHRAAPDGFDVRNVYISLPAAGRTMGCFAPATRAGVEFKSIMERTCDIYIANLTAWCYSARSDRQ